MGRELQKGVLAVLGFGSQRQIGLIIDKGTKALSKNRVIIGGRYADRSGGNVHASFLVMRIPTRDSIPRSACEASRRRVRRRPLGCVKCGNTSATPPPTIRGFRLLTSVVKSWRRSFSPFFQYFRILCPVPVYFCCCSATAYCCSFIVRFCPDSICPLWISHSLS